MLHHISDAKWQMHAAIRRPCPYCDVPVNAMEWPQHCAAEHEPSLHGKNAEKRERARYAALHSK